jgi:UrcA family protein
MTRKTLKLTTKAVLGAFATLAAIAPLYSHAADATVTVTRQVSYAGIDINTSDGAHTIYVRLKHAARSLCIAPNEEFAGPSWKYRECIQEAVAKAVHEAKSPLLTQMFVGDYGSEIAAQLGVDKGARVATLP